MKPFEMTDDDAVRRLLEESDVAPSDQLESSLLALRSAGETAPASAPSPELLAFMTPPATVQVVPLRRRRNVRGAFMVAAALAGTGLGVSGVAAANPDFRAAADQAVHNVVGFFAPSSAGNAEAPDSGQGRPAGIPAAPGPDEAGTNGTGTGSADEDPAGKASDSAAEATEQSIPGRSRAPGQPTETPGGHNRSDEGGQNGAEHPPAPPFRGVPSPPPFDGTLPGPSEAEEPKETSDKRLPLKDSDLPDPAQIPDLPVLPDPQG